jgi:hypothetical protein
MTITKVRASYQSLQFSEEMVVLKEKNIACLAVINKVLLCVVSFLEIISCQVTLGQFQPVSCF